ncbi:hypothetical protein DITRI_Ditri01bG0158500 [Diplodiscus trichospermus]
MGIRDFISWSTDSVKGLLQSSYGHGSTTITNVNKVVKVDAVQKVNQRLFDPETRSKISRVATDVAKNATIQSLKNILGAYPAFKFVSESLSDHEKSKNMNKSKNRNKSNNGEIYLKALQARVGKLEKEVGVLRKQVAIKDQAIEMMALQATVRNLEKEVGVLREQAAIKDEAKPRKTVQASEKPEDKESAQPDDGNHPLHL